MGTTHRTDSFYCNFRMLCGSTDWISLGNGKEGKSRTEHPATNGVLRPGGSTLSRLAAADPSRAHATADKPMRPGIVFRLLIRRQNRIECRFRLALDRH